MATDDRKGDNSERLHGCPHPDFSTAMHSATNKEKTEINSTDIDYNSGLSCGVGGANAREERRQSYTILHTPDLSAPKHIRTKVNATT